MRLVDQERIELRFRKASLVPCVVSDTELLRVDFRGEELFDAIGRTCQPILKFRQERRIGRRCERFDVRELEIEFAVNLDEDWRDACVVYGQISIRGGGHQFRIILLNVLCKETKVRTCIRTRLPVEGDGPYLVESIKLIRRQVGDIRLESFV